MSRKSWAEETREDVISWWLDVSDRTVSDAIARAIGLTIAECVRLAFTATPSSPETVGRILALLEPRDEDGGS